MGICVRIQSGADGDDGDRDVDGDVDGDGDGDGMEIIYQKYLGKQVGYVNVSIKASADLEPSTCQSFHRPRAFY